MSRALPVTEHFYTVQGEGCNTGTAAYFVRLAGCNVCCPWCDSKNSWTAEEAVPMSPEEILETVRSSGAETVVITGGEPLMHDLDELCRVLKTSGLHLFLETSGSSPKSGEFDWICVSPKRNRLPLEENYRAADELKVVVGGEEDFEWAEMNASKVRRECVLFLQPEWGSLDRSLPLIVEYVKRHPEWRISLQTHKFMNIP